LYPIWEHGVLTQIRFKFTIMNIKPIRSNVDHEQALLQINSLMDAVEGIAEAHELEVLSILVDYYENKTFPILVTTGLEALKFRTDKLGWTQKDLEDYLNLWSIASEIL